MTSIDEINHFHRLTIYSNEGTTGRRGRGVLYSDQIIEGTITVSIIIAAAFFSRIRADDDDDEALLCT